MKNTTKVSKMSLEKSFQEAILQAVPRYISNDRSNFDAISKELENNKKKLSKSFPKQFEQWKQTKSDWDKRSIIYGILDKKIGNKLQLWQLVERYIDDRYAEKALDIANSYLTEKEVKDPNYWASLAKVQIVLTKYQEAEQSLRKCLQINPKHEKGLLHWADLLHLSQREKEAHQLYNQILEESNFLQKKNNKSLNFEDLVGFGAVIHSPIYAIAWLSQDKNAPKHIWNWAANEFYYSPYFRSNHAYFLIKKENALEGFAKLLALSREMPWYKDAVVNAHNLIEQLNMNQNMTEEKQRLALIIEKNDW